LRPEGRPELVRAIGRWSLTGLVLNAIIGSGIFGLPSVVAGLLGRASVYAYLIAAVGIGVIMACFAEVASQFREAGGPYLYARAAFGRLVGIQMGWLAWLVRLTASAAAANLFAIYLAEFWPQARDPFLRALVLTLFVGVLAAVNYRGVSAGARFSSIFAVAKLLPLAVFIGVGLFFVGHARSGELAAATPGAWLEAVLVLVFAFGGFEAAMMPMGEAKDPRRDAPVALFMGLAICAIVYTLIQLVVEGVLPSPAGTDRPLALAARQFLGPSGAVLLTLGALVSVYGYLSGQMLNAPRLTYAFAEQEDFPAFFAAIHPRFRTPHVSIVIFALLVWTLAIAGTFRWNVTLSALARLFTYGLVCASLLVLRHKQPAASAFRLPAGGVLAGVGIVFSLVLVSRMGRNELVIVLATAAIALLNWAWVRRRPLRR
jgi:amino acid transporter